MSNLLRLIWQGALVFIYYEHIRFQIVIIPETRNQIRKRGETERPYE